MEEELYKDLKKLRIDHPSAKTVAFSGKRAVLCFFLVAAGVAAFLLVKNFEGAARQVAVMTVSGPAAGERPVLMTAGGYIVAQCEITVSSKIAGRIASLPFNEGDLIQQGDVIAILDGEEFQVQREEAQAKLGKAYLNRKHKQELHQKDVAEVRRRQELFKEHLISPAELDKDEKAAVVSRLELDQALSEVEVCKKQLELAEIRAAESTIKAPITGTVIDKIADVGEMLFPMKTFEGISGSAVVTLADLEVMNVEVDINEDEINTIHMGIPALITPDSLPDKTYEGEVIAISPMADRQKNVVPVKVRIKNPDAHLKPDMSAKVAFREKTSVMPPEDPGITIPRNAVLDRDGKSLVFVVENGKVLEREVRLGGIRGAVVTVERGVMAGEKLVVEGHAHLRHNDTVSFTERSALDF